VNGHLGHFQADPQAVGEMSRITRFLVSGDNAHMLPERLAKAKNAVSISLPVGKRRGNAAPAK
jgi:hypothetical protein